MSELEPGNNKVKVEKETENVDIDKKEVREKVCSERKEKTVFKKETKNEKEVTLNKGEKTTAKGGTDNAPKGNTPLKKGRVVVMEDTPKGKEKERGTKLVNQRITKFLTRRNTEKGTKTETPVGNRLYVGEKEYGLVGGTGCKNNTAKPDCNKPDTDLIINNKVGGADGRIGKRTELQQQQAVYQPDEQCAGSSAELRSLGCGGRFTDILERRTEQGKEQQRSAGTAD